MGSVEQKNAFEHVKKLQIQIILCMCKVSAGLCSLFIHSVVSIDSVTWQWRLWSDYIDAKSDLGLHYNAQRHIFTWCSSYKELEYIF